MNSKTKFGVRFKVLKHGGKFRWVVSISNHLVKSGVCRRQMDARIEGRNAALEKDRELIAQYGIPEPRKGARLI